MDFGSLDNVMSTQGTCELSSGRVVLFLSSLLFPDLSPYTYFVVPDMVHAGRWRLASPWTAMQPRLTPMGHFLAR